MRRHDRDPLEKAGFPQMADGGDERLRGQGEIVETVGGTGVPPLQADDAIPEGLEVGPVVDTPGNEMKAAGKGLP